MHDKLKNFYPDRRCYYMCPNVRPEIPRSNPKSQSQMSENRFPSGSKLTLCNQIQTGYLFWYYLTVNKLPWSLHTGFFPRPCRRDHLLRPFLPVESAVSEAEFNGVLCEATKPFSLKLVLEGYRRALKTLSLFLLQLTTDFVEVEVEYEKLGKHCFFCKSLTHEDSEKHRCPLSRGHTEDRRTLGITQQNTLDRIEEGRRRQEERRYSRFPNLPARKEARWTNSRNANREIEISSRGYSPRSEMGKSLNFEENRRRYDDRHLAFRYSTPRETQSQHDSHERISTSRRTQDYKVKESTGPAPPRQSQVSPAREAISLSHRSPVAAPTLEQRRRNLDSRLSDPRSGNLSTEERISAKERLSVNTRRTSGSERTEGEAVPHQDKDKLPMSPSSSTRTITAIPRPSSSTIFETGRLGICERSPIRTLSEDRIHVSLRLGPLREDEENEEDNAFDLQLQQTLSSKAAGKKVATQTKDKKRPARNSPQGFPVKRRLTTKAHPSPRGKLMMDAITAGVRTQTKKKQKTTPATMTTIIPPRVRKEKNFRPPQGSLP
ncbi:hypothetical protein F2Q68_00008697 [Brassica cretica]|uniref:Zinc knuckle CX2CX4HX4C domain-containing protein n=1 Tax=Brassica cretica TaxID=69181 RepID=A0A8S9KTC8_BRACR|nr:hypothetical protein F2Q68_00008697 [Brassica cretica]